MDVSLLLYILTFCMYFLLEDVQEFEKSVLGRSSRSRSAKVADDDSEKDKGTDSEEDKDEDEDEAPRKRPVSPTMSSIVAL